MVSSTGAGMIGWFRSTDSMDKAPAEFSQSCKFTAGSPVKANAIEQHAADNHAVGAEKFCGGVHHRVRRQRQALAQLRGGKRRIHEGGQAGLVSHPEDLETSRTSISGLSNISANLSRVLTLMAANAV